MLCENNISEGYNESPHLIRLWWILPKGEGIIIR